MKTTSLITVMSRRKNHRTASIIVRTKIFFVNRSLVKCSSGKERYKMIKAQATAKGHFSREKKDAATFDRFHLIFPSTIKRKSISRTVIEVAIKETIAWFEANISSINVAMLPPHNQEPINLIKR